MFSRSPLPKPSPPAPFYEKVKQAISEKIAAGVWRPQPHSVRSRTGRAVWL